MRKILIILLSLSAIIFTIWYMHFGSLTENSGALSKTGLRHPIYFAVWGILTFFALYLPLLLQFKQKFSKYKFQYIFASLSAIGMVLTLTCDFDYDKKVQYALHCAGSLTFSVLSGVIIFIFFCLQYKQNIFYKISTILIGIILIFDLIFLLIFKETALIESVPVIIGIILLTISYSLNKTFEVKNIEIKQGT